VNVVAVADTLPTVVHVDPPFALRCTTLDVTPLALLLLHAKFTCVAETALALKPVGAFSVTVVPDEPASALTSKFAIGLPRPVTSS
jgi:hypothetical protein